MKGNFIALFNRKNTKAFFVFAVLLLLSINFDLTWCAPHDVEKKLCSGTNNNSYVRDNTQIFSSLGQRCTVENDAYILGAMYHKYSLDVKNFDKDSAHERWSNTAYLDASKYDNLASSNATGLCVFNERLAKQQLQSGVKIGMTCNPFAILYCRQEYDAALTMNDYCDCNYLYSTKGKDACYGRAGVPCKFQQNPDTTDPFLKLPDAIDCHPSLVCKDHSEIERKRIFNKVFHGFGINPIVREYMTENALAYCDCKSSSLTINALNECVRSVSGIHRLLNIHTFRFSWLLLLIWFVRFSYDFK